MAVKVVFMGTPEAAVPSLRAVEDAHEVVAVYTRRDKPRGRGRRLEPSPIKAAATGLGLEVVEPASLKRPEEQERLRGFAPDVVTVVAFGQILPTEVLETPRHGCVNVHFSLLPRWRGAAPVARAIMAGDTETGVTTMQMDPGLDTGPVLLVRREPIHPDDTTGTLTERLAAIGAELLTETLEGLAAGTLRAAPQPADGATYADKVTPADAELDLDRPAAELARRVRALAPKPGAVVGFRGKRLKILAAEAVPGSGGEVGEVNVSGDGVPEVSTGDGRLRLLEVQPEGKGRMAGDAFARGHRPEPGERLSRAG